VTNQAYYEKEFARLTAADEAKTRTILTLYTHIKKQAGDKGSQFDEILALNATIQQKDKDIEKLKEAHKDEIAALNKSSDVVRSDLQKQLSISDEYLVSNITKKEALAAELSTEKARTANLTEELARKNKSVAEHLDRISTLEVEVQKQIAQYQAQ
jgi:chromosome segregation ATPase